MKQTKKVQGILALFKQHLFEFLFGHEYLNTTQWVQNTSQINIGDFFSIDFLSLGKSFEFMTDV